MTRYGQDKIRVVEVKGSMVTVVDEHGKSLTRNASVFKRRISRQEKCPNNSNSESFLANKKQAATEIIEQRTHPVRDRMQTAKYTLSQGETR